MKGYVSGMFVSTNMKESHKLTELKRDCKICSEIFVNRTKEQCNKCKEKYINSSV